MTLNDLSDHGSQTKPLVRSEAFMTNIVVRKADLLDIEIGLALGQEISSLSGVEHLPVGPDRVNRLAQGWLASRQYDVLVADCADLAGYGTWPLGLAEARVRRRRTMLGFFVGFCHLNPESAVKLANDVAIFIRPDSDGCLAAARLIQRFVEWAQRRRR